MASANVRFVLRSLSRSPVVTVAAVLSLSLAVGATTALFTVTNQMLLRTLPVKEPHQLVLFNWDGQFIGGSSRGFHDSFSYPAYVDFRDGNPGVFTGIAAQYQDTVDLSANGPAQRAVAELVSGNYFQVLGVQAAIGRTLMPQDDLVKNAEPYAVLSYEFWQRRFGGDPSVLNRVIDINSHPMTVVGVLQPGFAGFDRVSPSDVFVPMMMKNAITPTWDDMARRNSIWLHIFGRLAPGVTPKRAAAAMSVPLHHVLENDLAANGRNRDFVAHYLQNTLSFSEAAKGINGFEKQFAKPLYVLLAMVGTLLLIACVNIANLLVTRAAARQKEIAIRLSLGATRAAIVRLILAESFCIAISGGVFGLLLSSWLVRVLVSFLPFDNMPHAIQINPDRSVLAFAIVVTALTTLFFGLLPALEATSPDLAPTLKSEAASASLGPRQTWVRRSLVCAQVALSLVLLFGAGLFARSLNRLLHVPSGMNVSRVLEFSLDPSLHKYTPQRSREFFLALQDKVRRLPGVLSVSAVAHPVLANDNWQNTVHIEGYKSHEGEDMNPGFNQMLPGFFTTMGVPLIAGRDFSDRDTAGSPQKVIVNQTFIHRFVPHGSPLGLHLGLGGGGPMPYEIIGVVGDMKGGNLKEEAKPYTYMAALQEEKPSSMTYYVRTAQDSKAMTQSIRQTLRGLDASLPLYDVKTLEHQIDQTHFIDRLFAWLSSAFGVLATLLASIGLYGITSYSVSRRTQEIGIRVALGAEQRNVFRMIMREVFLLALVGIMAGAPLAFWLARIAAGELFGVKPNDLFVITATVLVILAVSALASFVPARRAARIDPVEALRHE
jgi:predicted permease